MKKMLIIIMLIALSGSGSAIAAQSCNERGVSEPVPSGECSSNGEYYCSNGKWQNHAGRCGSVVSQQNRVDFNRDGAIDDKPPISSEKSKIHAVMPEAKK